MKSFQQKISAFIQKPERVFLSIGLFFGTLFVFLIPPMQAPDELSHFFRAYQLSSGQLIASTYDFGAGGEIPTSLKTMSYELLLDGLEASKGDDKLKPGDVTKYTSQPLEASEKSSAQFTGAALYSPVAYIPQIFGIWVGQIFNQPAIILFYLARLCNLLVFLALVWMAIKFMPWGKWALVVLALLPSTVVQAASLSSDGVTNGVALLAVAYFLYLYGASKKIIPRQMGVLAILLLLLSLSKQTFFIFAALPLLLPSKRFTSKKTYLTYGIGVAFLCTIATALWAGMVSSQLGYMDNAFRPGVFISVTEQLKHIILAPTAFPHVLFDTMMSSQTNKIAKSFVMTEHVAPIFVAFISYATLIGVVLAEAKPRRLIQSMRLKLAGLFVVATLGVIGALYLTYNAVGARVVEGLQGRYFIPHALLLMIVALTGNWRLIIPKHRTLLLAIGIIVPLCSILAVILRSFYGYV